MYPHSSSTRTETPFFKERLVSSNPDVDVDIFAFSCSSSSDEVGNLPSRTSKTRYNLDDDGFETAAVHGKSAASFLAALDKMPTPVSFSTIPVDKTQLPPSQLPPHILPPSKSSVPWPKRFSIDDSIDSLPAFSQTEKEEEKARGGQSLDSASWTSIPLSSSPVSLPVPERMMEGQFLCACKAPKGAEEVERGLDCGVSDLDESDEVGDQCHSAYSQREGDEVQKGEGGREREGELKGRGIERMWEHECAHESGMMCSVCCSCDTGFWDRKAASKRMENPVCDKIVDGEMETEIPAADVDDAQLIKDEQNESLVFPLPYPYGSSSGMLDTMVEKVGDESVGKPEEPKDGNDETEALEGQPDELGLAASAVAIMHGMAWWMENTQRLRKGCA